MGNRGRRARPSIFFNDIDVTDETASYLKSMTYTDVAGGDSDSISIEMHNADMKWLNEWLPKKGDRIKASISLLDWDEYGDTGKLDCGKFVLDDISMNGGPLAAKISGIALPANSDFKSKERTQTWKDTTTKLIALEITDRYGLGLVFDATEYKISSLEQSEKADCAFLYDLSKSYGMTMKVFASKCIIFDQSKYEGKKAAVTIDRKDFIDDDWKYIDSLQGSYTGARASYKSGSDSKEISVYVGLADEKDPKARTKKISEQYDSEQDAKFKAAADVNYENQSVTTLTGSVFPNTKYVAGITVTVTGLGKASGKYFIDQVKTTVSDGASKMDIEMHRCQRRIVYVPEEEHPSSGAAGGITYRVNTSIGLNMRTGPNADIITTIPDATVVSADGSENAGWYHICYNGTWGWSYHDYLVRLT